MASLLSRDVCDGFWQCDQCERLCLHSVSSSPDASLSAEDPKAAGDAETEIGSLAAAARPNAAVPERQKQQQKLLNSSLPRARCVRCIGVLLAQD